MLKGENISKSYGELQVLKNVTIEVKKGEVIAIIGSSGAGKSTLLHILGTLDKPDTGKYTIEGENILSKNEKQLAQFRNEKIGFVFQFHHLLPEFTAIENVCIPAFIKGVSSLKAEIRAKELLDYLGLNGRYYHKPSELSGGEQQRVAVARALMNEPSIVMADEPSGNLDSVNSEQLHQLFFDLRDKFQQTFIIVTHNKDLASMADRTLIMKDGEIVEELKR